MCRFFYTNISCPCEKSPSDNVPEPLLRNLRVSCSEDHISEVELRRGHFGRQPRLRSLSIERCQIGSVPDEAFAGLEALTSLALTNTGIWELPRGGRVFCPLGSLQSLNLSENAVRDLADLGFEVAANDVRQRCRIPLRILDLSRNRLKSLPSAGLGQLDRLETLDLSGNEISVVDDAAIAGLSGLKVLRLNGNRLVALPPKLLRGAADSLQELGLQNNSLTGLAPGLFKGLRHLLVLNLSDNALTNDMVSEGAFATLLRLVALDLSGNKLSRLDRRLLSPLTSLQLLDLRGNRLHAMAGDAFLSQYNLHTLRLDDNGIESLHPRSFSGLSVLSSLSLASNRLQDVRPEVVENLTSLADLDLSGNLFDGVPSEAMAALTRLQRVDFSKNMISDMSSTGALDGLAAVREIKLSENGIEKVDAAVFTGGAVVSLEVLDLSGNRIKQLEQGIFSSLRNLKALRLQGNILEDINGILTGQTGLKELNVSSNRLQWFDYAFIPKNLERLDISHNQIEELGNYYKLDSGFGLKLLRAEGNKIKAVRPLSLPSSVEQALLRDNRIRSVQPGSFAEKVNLTEVDLRKNLLRQLELSAIAVNTAGALGKHLLLCLSGAALRIFDQRLPPATIVFTFCPAPTAFSLLADS